MPCPRMSVCMRFGVGDRIRGTLCGKAMGGEEGDITNIISLHFRYSICVISMAVGMSFLT